MAVFVCGALSAQTPAWEPSAGHTQVPIWPKEPPDSLPVAGPEFMKKEEDPVAAKSYIAVERVSVPTMTVYPPKGKNTGVAVVVFPGGGYKILAIDLQGTEVCDWLTSRGITAVLLKYRVPAPKTPPNWGGYPESSMALEDAQRTIGLVRSRAAEWDIDPRKIGVLGFSAGGHLAAAISTHFDKRLYPTVDAADKAGCRPDFAVAIFPGRLWFDDKHHELNPNVPVTKQTPPTFLLHAQDDPVNDVKHSLVYYEALTKVGVPAEMHLFAEGGHAFGLRRTKFPITDWPKLVETWLGTIGMTSQ
jgi:acetyl esterase/lipase